MPKGALPKWTGSGVPSWQSTEDRADTPSTCEMQLGPSLNRCAVLPSRAVAVRYSQNSQALVTFRKVSPL
eukprot:11703076-Alexandrium_andersonii.AAC.1